MYPLRQSTASQEIKLGPFLDDDDGITEQTGLTIANTDIKLTKHGSATEASKNSGGGTHVANGRYSAVLDATDTDTLGGLEVDCRPADCLPVHRNFWVLAPAVFDAFFGTGNLPANVKAISDDTNAADNLELLLEDGPGYIRKGTAQAGAAGTITLDASASAVDDFYNGHLIQIMSGTGANQSRIITDYVGATKVATVGENWATTPGADSVFQISPGGNAIGDVNVVSISDDTAAADNMEAAFDGTGFDVGNGFIRVDSVLGDVEGGVLGNLVDMETTLEDSIPADGTACSPRQALYILTQFLLERSMSSTTVTVRKPDGSTTLFTLTVDSAVTPTSITRAT